MPAVVNANKSKWYHHGKLHSYNDRPAVVKLIDSNLLRKEWYLNGLRHRGGDKPAVKVGKSTKEWFQCGVLHRDNDKPAVINE